MRIILYVLSTLAILSGFALSAASQSTWQETTAFSLLIVGSVLLSGGAIVGAVNRLTQTIEKTIPEAKK